MKLAGVERANTIQNVNAMMSLPRLDPITLLPPAPTTMYCLPSTEEDAGDGPRDNAVAPFNAPTGSF